MEIAIIGGGICGLSLALNLKERGIACASTSARLNSKNSASALHCCRMPLREFTALGLADELLKAGIENRESRFLQPFRPAHLQGIARQAGRLSVSGNLHPRGRLHMILYKAAQARLGADSVRTDYECTGAEQDERVSPCTSGQARRQTRQRARRHCGRLRGHQFNAPETILSR